MMFKRLLFIISVCYITCCISGCRVIECACDPVGCGTGGHEPWFPWYPLYLVSEEAQLTDEMTRASRRYGYVPEHLKQQYQELMTRQGYRTTSPQEMPRVSPQSVLQPTAQPTPIMIVPATGFAPVQQAPCNCQ